MNRKLAGVWFLGLTATALALGTVTAAPRHSKTTESKAKPIVVMISWSKNRIRYELNWQEVEAGNDLSYFLGEMHVACPAKDNSACPVVILAEDRVAFNDLVQVSTIAINAGFKDIRTFVYFSRRGNASEIFLTEPRKFSKSDPTGDDQKRHRE
jgi:biopolymer transport protein ExbD